MKNLFYIILCCVVSCGRQTENQFIDLAGTWSVALDSLNVGQQQAWFKQNAFTNTIQLPGTLCDAGLGTASTIKPTMDREVFLNLKRKFDYVGAAWYNKEIVLPASFKGKQAILTLERVLWTSEVWVDGQKVPTINQSLTTAHEFNLGALSPGKHLISIRIDNSKRHDISVKDMAHAYTNETQTMWNGVIGKLQIAAKDPVRIADVQVFPNLEDHKMSVQLHLADSGGEALNAKDMEVSCSVDGFPSLLIRPAEINDGQIVFDFDLPGAELWSEWQPKIYTAQVSIKGKGFSDSHTVRFGMREFKANGTKLSLNGKEVFMRGTLECNIFPLKGYPPMDKESWKKVFGSAKNYGLNHLRFHSWCPPKAAFEVADEMGFYLQVESPLWTLNVGDDPATVEFIRSECQQIMRTYGNHPSFCFFALGNELEGDFDLMSSIINQLKNQDHRHLYMLTSFTFQKGHGSAPEAVDEYWVTQWTKDGWVRGQGVFDSEYPNFNKDYHTALTSVTVPLITHEIGQYSVFPNLKEIEKYTGNLIPVNFKAVQEDLKRKGRLQLADQYTQASGKLAAILYKEEIERAYKTKGLAGFQLLDLHDFPGQGTALVGLLDAFWDSKGIISDREFRQFSAPVVPLVRFDKAIYLNSETFSAEIELANFGGTVLKDQKINWSLHTNPNENKASGTFNMAHIPEGNGIRIGSISADLKQYEKAEQLFLTVELVGTAYRNQWKIWVYPNQQIADKGTVQYTSDYAQAQAWLNTGKTVLLCPQQKQLAGLDGKFVQVFWSPVHFPNQPGTMGLLCDPAHPLYQQFPTAFHTDWQWWDICKHAKTMVLDSLPQVNPTLIMVDNFYKNRSLGLIFEAKVGTGKLLCTSIDFNADLKQRPASQQLLKSIYSYMNSDQFHPDNEVDFALIRKHTIQLNPNTGKTKGIYDN